VGRVGGVALIMPNCPQYGIAFYATARLGAIVVGNNPLYTTSEMEHQLRDCSPSVVVVLDLLFSDFADVFETVGQQHVVVARLNDYMSFPKKQLAPALKFKKLQREQGKPWPPVAKGAPVTWWEGWLDAAGPAPVAPLVDPQTHNARVIHTGGPAPRSQGAR